MDSHVVSAIIRLVLNLVMPQKAGSALQTATKNFSNVVYY